MPYDPSKHHRKSIRLQGYDYSQPGYYFLTINTHDRQHFFGNVVNGKMILNEQGKIAFDCWMEIPDHFPHVELDEFVVMPDHIHGILILHKIIEETSTPTGTEPIPSIILKPERKVNQYQKIIPKSVGSIVRGFKIGVTKWFRQNTTINTVWQKNYYEHIIRNKHSLANIRKYIIDNPKKWQRGVNGKW